MERSFGAKNLNNFLNSSPFRMSKFYVDIAVSCCDLLKEISCLELSEVQRVEAQLTDLDSSSGNKSNMSPLRN
jgi:hypothetical protein